LLAADGREGLRIFAEKRAEIDLVLLDLIMPEMNGKEVLQEIRRIEPGAVVIMQSGYMDKIKVKDLLEIGIFGFLEKPFSLKRLLEMMDQALKPKKKQNGG
jgi:DNA-binding NtrC family response regulator